MNDPSPMVIHGLCGAWISKGMMTDKEVDEAYETVRFNSFAQRIVKKILVDLTGSFKTVCELYDEYLDDFEVDETNCTYVLWQIYFDQKRRDESNKYLLASQESLARKVMDAITYYNLSIASGVTVEKSKSKYYEDVTEAVQFYYSQKARINGSGRPPTKRTRVV